MLGGSIVHGPKGCRLSAQPMALHVGRCPTSIKTELWKGEATAPGSKSETCRISSGKSYRFGVVLGSRTSNLRSSS